MRTGWSSSTRVSTGPSFDELADDVDRLGLPAVAGFCTHPHWDHLLWHPRFGDVPRYATTDCARMATDTRERAQAMAAESATGVPLELVALVTTLPADGGPVPGEVIEHEAHALGHAAVAASQTVESCSPATCSRTS